MPTYFSTSTRVHLAVSTLSDTVTPFPEQKKSYVATNNAETTERTLKNGRVLRERNVSCCGEESRIHFLGAHKDMPFLMVHAGADLLHGDANINRPLRRQPDRQSLAVPTRNESRPSASPVSTLTSLATTPTGFEDDVVEEDRLERRDLKLTKQSPNGGHVVPSVELPLNASTIPLTAANVRALNSHQTIISPQALSLIVSLSSKSFGRTLDARNTPQDIKMDVFFNGEFVASNTLPARYNTAKDKRDDLTQQFSGRRVHRLVERAWVLVPPAQNADGSIRGQKRTKAASAGPEERWKQIAAAIQAEADLQGFNRFGERPPVGEYLDCLAKVSMPKAVEAMQRPGGPKFGVVDVVISMGKGRKYDASTTYLQAPERLHDPTFTVKGALAAIQEEEGEEVKGTGRRLRSAQVGVEGVDSSQNVPSQPSRDGTSSLAGLPLTSGRSLTSSERSSHTPAHNSEIYPGSKSLFTPTSSFGTLYAVSSQSQQQQPYTEFVSHTTEGYPERFVPPSGRKSAPVARCRKPLARAEPLSILSDDFSSPEDGRHRRGQMRVRRAALKGLPVPAAPVFQPPSATTSFAPSMRSSNSLPSTQELPVTQGALSQTSDPTSMTPKKRRYGEIAPIPEDTPSPRRRRTRRDSIAASPRRSVKEGLKTVEGFLGVSRRGVIVRSDSLTNVSADKQDDSADGQPTSAQKTIDPVVRSVWLERDGVPFRVATLRKPLDLTKSQHLDNAAENSSPVQPLPSVPSYKSLADAPTLSKPLTPPTVSSSPLKPSTNTRAASSAHKGRSSPIKARTTRRSSTKSGEPNSTGGASATPSTSFSSSASLVDTLARSFVMPELSRDCVVTYAQEGQWADSGGGSGVLRQIKSERAGEFREDSVLMGVRFLLG